MVDPDLQLLVESALVDTARILRKTDTPNATGGSATTYPDSGQWFLCRIRPKRGGVQILVGAQLQQNLAYLIDYPRCVGTAAGGAEEPLIPSVVSATGVYFGDADRLLINGFTYTVNSVSDLGSDYPAQQASLWRKQV